MNKPTFDLTPLVVEYFFSIVDAYLSEDKDNSVDDLLFENRKCEKMIIEGLYDRVYKENPYKAMYLMEKILDERRTKIKSIVHKK